MKGEKQIRFGFTIEVKRSNKLTDIQEDSNSIKITLVTANKLQNLVIVIKKNSKQ